MFLFRDSVSVLKTGKSNLNGHIMVRLANINLKKFVRKLMLFLKQSNRTLPFYDSKK